MRTLASTFFIIVLFLSGCSQDVVIEGFDSDAWKEDALACEGHRAKMQDDILEASEELKGLSPREIMSVLGKPNKEELYKRNQKFFIYYLEPGAQCDGSSAQSKTEVVFIRFSALNIANEVFIRMY